MTTPSFAGASSWTFLHGFSQSHQSWWPVIQALRERCVASGYGLPQMRLPDLPGHGLSGPPVDKLDVDADFLSAIAGHGSTTDGSTILIGYSLGARVALTAAIADSSPPGSTSGRIAGLILIGGSPGIADPIARAERSVVDTARAERVIDVGVEEFVEEWITLDLFGDLVPTDLEFRRRNTAVGLSGSLRYHGTGSQMSLWDHLGAISVPTLIVVGARDRKFVDIAARMQSSIRDAEVATIGAADHAAHLQRPDVFAEVAIRWMSELRHDGLSQRGR